MTITNAFSVDFSSDFDQVVADGFITNPDVIRGRMPNGDRIADATFQGAWAAADQWVAVRTRFQGPTPPDLVEAVYRMTSRLLERDNSPAGLTGMGDLGSFQVPSYDPDIRTLIGPWKPVVFG